MNQQQFESNTQKTAGNVVGPPEFTQHLDSFGRDDEHLWCASIKTTSRVASGASDDLPVQARGFSVVSEELDGLARVRGQSSVSA